jgi:hypothetical protein
VAACHAMHLLRSRAIRPNLELKTGPKQLLVSLPLDITLPHENKKEGRLKVVWANQTVFFLNKNDKKLL